MSEDRKVTHISKYWLFVIIMTRTSFKVNLHPTVCLNVKELLARSRRHIRSLSDSNGIRTSNHLVCKWTLTDLAKLVSLLNGWVFVYKVSGCGFESCWYRKSLCNETCVVIIDSASSSFRLKLKEMLHITWFIYKRWVWNYENDSINTPSLH